MAKEPGLKIIVMTHSFHLSDELASPFNAEVVLGIGLNEMTKLCCKLRAKLVTFLWRVIYKN